MCPTSEDSSPKIRVAQLDPVIPSVHRRGSCYWSLEGSEVATFDFKENEKLEFKG